MASLRTWFKAVQPHSFIASLVGVALGTSIAWRESRSFDAIGLVLTAIGVVCLHAATNMSNDSIDFRRGVDDLPPHLVSPFTGGARVLPDRAVPFEAQRRLGIGLEKSLTLYEILVGSALVLLAILAASRLISWVAGIGLIALIPLARARSVLRVHYREYPAHIPANAGTIQAVLLLGIAMTVAYLISPVRRLSADGDGDEDRDR